MGIIHVGNCILSVVALAISVSLASPSAAQTPFPLGAHFSQTSSKVVAKPAKDNETFPCKRDSKMQTPGGPSSKHTVTLSWKPSVSLSTPPAAGEGYNLYRLNPDSSCTKINGEGLIRETVYEDRFVELGKTYRYAARAVKQNTESGPSNVIEVSVPLT